MSVSSEPAASKILVVDDEIDLARSLQRLLRRARFEVAIVKDGPSALAELDTLAPDVVISDYGLPMMNGTELVREIRRRRPDMICFLLSGDTAPDDAVCEWVTKPFDSAALVASIKQRLSDAAVKS